MTLLRFTQKSLNILLSNSHLLTRLGKYQKPILQQLIIKSLTNPQVNLSHQVLQNICGSTKTSNQPGFNDQRLIYIKLLKSLGRKSKSTTLRTLILLISFNRLPNSQTTEEGDSTSTYHCALLSTFTRLFLIKVPLNKQALHSNIMYGSSIFHHLFHKKYALTKVLIYVHSYFLRQQIYKLKKSHPLHMYHKMSSFIILVEL